MPSCSARKTIPATASSIARSPTRLCFAGSAPWDVLAFVQPIFIDYDMNICQSRIGEALTSTSYAWRNLYENGVHVSFGHRLPVEKFDTMPNL